MSQTNKTIWRVYETVCGFWECGESIDRPTTGFAHPTHAIDPALTTAITTCNIQPVVPKVDYKGTGGNFKCESRCFNILANETFTYNYTFPIPVVVMNVKISTLANNMNDVINIHTNDVTVGALTADAFIGDHVLHVNPEAIAVATIGTTLILSTNSVPENTGVITHIDPIANTLTTETALLANHTVNPQTLVIFRGDYIKDFIIGPPGYYRVGETVFGGVAVPTSATMIFNYENKTADAKTLYVYVEYIY